MNDRFKFRVWLEYSKLYYGLDSFYYNSLKNKYTFHFEDGHTKTIKEKDCVIEQCTGFKDSNGKLIYEGDIVKETSFDEDSCTGIGFVETGVVCFGGGEYPCSFTLKNERFYRGYALLGYGVNRLELEVIGNIHENPELVEESK